MTIADRIKKIREIFGITSNEFAKITGIHPVSIRKYETNKMIPGNDVIEKMSEALKLPKMIFEGMPKQYTNYNYSGDFFQQLFLLIDNGTISIDISNQELYDNFLFRLNPKLSDFIIIKHDGKELSLDDISIELRCNNRANLVNRTLFSMYFNDTQKAKEVLASKHWNSKSRESKEEYVARLNKSAMESQIELMLRGHSWRDYMDGPRNLEDVQALLEKVIQEGGNYYDFVYKMDVPESVKALYIEEFEDTWIENHYIEKDEFPINGTEEEKDAFALNIIAKIDHYKETHPDFHKIIKAAHIAKAKEDYERYLEEKNSDEIKKSGAQN